jgi:hypothetical protein
MSATSLGVGLGLGLPLALFVLVSIHRAVLVVREKEVVIMERFGRFKDVLTAGVHVVVPWVDRPKVCARGCRRRRRCGGAAAAPAPRAVAASRSVEVEARRAGEGWGGALIVGVPPRD